jgi:hypothetical protein
MCEQEEEQVPTVPGKVHAAAQDTFRNNPNYPYKDYDADSYEIPLARVDYRCNTRLDVISNSIIAEGVDAARWHDVATHAIGNAEQDQETRDIYPRGKWVHYNNPSSWALRSVLVKHGVSNVQHCNQ